MTERDPVEQRVRAGLEARAERTDVSAPVVGRAREAARRRQRTRIVGAAAAVVLALTGAGVVLQQRDDTPAPATDRQGEPDPPRPEAATDEWRTEYWGRISVEVPAEWGYGGAPRDDGSGTSSCFPEVVRDATGQPARPEGRRTGYVGRPIQLTDECVQYPEDRRDAARAPYVWLGADVEPGTVDLGYDFVQETFELYGTTVTVGSDDAALRSRILGSVEQGDLCRSVVAGDDVLSTPGAGRELDDAETLTVCAYRRPAPLTRRDPATLAYALRLGEEAARDYLAALSAGEEPRDQCPTVDYVEDEWVVLELADGSGSVLRRDVAHFACAGIDVGAGDLSGFKTVRMTPAIVEPWAVDGISATVYGPGSGKGTMLESFIGRLG